MTKKAQSSSRSSAAYCRCVRRSPRPDLVLRALASIFAGLLLLTAWYAHMSEGPVHIASPLDAADADAAAAAAAAAADAAASRLSASTSARDAPPPLPLPLSEPEPEPEPEPAQEAPEPCPIGIVVTTFDFAEGLEALLVSVAGQSVRCPAVVVVDNGCRPGSRVAVERLRPELPELEHVLACGANTTYAMLQNAGLARVPVARAAWVLFLNDDVVLHAGALANAVVATRSLPRIGGAVCKVVAGDDSSHSHLLEAGGFVADGLKGWVGVYGRNAGRFDDEVNFAREVDYGSGACFLADRGLLEAMGGFPTAYPAYYEDTDVAMSIRRHFNRSIYFHPFIVVSHRESATFSQRKTGLMTESARTFGQRWARLMPGQGTWQTAMSAPDNVFRLRHARVVLPSSGRGGLRLRILFVDEVLPRRDYGAGFTRAFYNVLILTALGARVTCIATGEGFALSGRRISAADRAELQARGVELIRKRTVDQLLVERPDGYDAVLVSRWPTFSNVQAAVRDRCPKCLLWFDAEALWYRRQEQLLALLSESPSAKEQLSPYARKLEVISKLTQATVNEEKRVEMAVLAKADGIVAVSRVERALISKYLVSRKITPVVVVNSNVVTFVARKVPPFDKRSDIVLFVGAFNGNWYYNGDAVYYAVEFVLPIVRKRVPHIQFVVIGSKTPATMRRYLATVENCVVVDSAPTHVIHSWYDKAKLLLVPHLYATGLPQKVFDAATFGLPSVMSATVLGLLVDRRNQPSGRRKTPAELGESIRRLLQDAKAWQAASAQALGFIRSFTLATSVRTWHDTLHRFVSDEALLESLNAKQTAVADIELMLRPMTPAATSLAPVNVTSAGAVPEAQLCGSEDPSGPCNPELSHKPNATELLFDAHFYVSLYGDLARLRKWIEKKPLAAWNHYVKHGRAEHRVGCRFCKPGAELRLPAPPKAKAKKL